MFVSCLGLLSPLGHSSILDECQSGFNYLIETENGWTYALIGLPSNLNSEYANHTTRISVNGTFYPNLVSNSSLNPNFRGIVYVSSYVVNETTFTFAQTIVMVSGTITSTSTNTKQISPTTITGTTGEVTLTTISLTGLLDYTEAYCVTPLLTTTSTSTYENSETSIPGFTSLSIILGFSIGLSIMVIKRRRRV